MQRERQPRIDRRSVLQSAAGAVFLAPLAGSLFGGADDPGRAQGCVVGEPTAEKIGAQVLADGGNAVDAIVAAALAATVAAPHQTGIGGYCAHGMFAVEEGTRIVALDANSAAPAAMATDTFRPDGSGQVPEQRNEFGWLAAGVPGVLAGLQLALDRFGTKPLRQLVQPAIALAKDGIHWPASLTSVIRTSAAQFARDPGSHRLYFRDDKPLAAGSRFQNPELAEMLQSLAAANSVESFYRGEIAQRIVAAFQKNGGLITAQDMADYQAKLLEPLVIQIQDRTIHTAPLTAGGLTVLQTLLTLHALKWNEMPAGVARTHAQIEAMRLAWRDRLSLLGDPEFSAIPVQKLLSTDYARDCAEQVERAVQTGQLLSHTVTPRDHQGTINLSAADAKGNFAALTLTHGNSFGARVTVEGLGLTLGHGMSRFDPHPGHPNGPGPRKRPLHNMCPTIVTRDGKPMLAAGGRGGRKIPNAMIELLAQFVLLDQPLASAIAVPRIHTDGDKVVEIEKSWPGEETTALAKMGYTVKTGSSATLSAVAAEDRQLRAKSR